MRHRRHWLSYLFALLGLGMLAGSVYWYRNVEAFIVHAEVAEGTVVDLVRSGSSGSGSGDSTYRPLVVFVDAAGREIEFVSSVGSNPPAYRRGEKLEVLYQPGDPENARINAFFSLWLGPLILGFIGGVFALLGFGVGLAGVLRQRDRAYLRKRGMPVLTELQSVSAIKHRRNRGGRAAYRVVTRWQDPRTAEMHVFKSGNLGFDPSDYLKGKRITVFIDKDDPGKYHMDLSMLPKSAA